MKFDYLSPHKLSWGGKKYTGGKTVICQTICTFTFYCYVTSEQEYWIGRVGPLPCNLNFTQWRHELRVAFSMLPSCSCLESDFWQCLWDFHCSNHHHFPSISTFPLFSFHKIRLIWPQLSMWMTSYWGAIVILQLLHCDFGILQNSAASGGKGVVSNFSWRGTIYSRHFPLLVLD